MKENRPFKGRLFLCVFYFNSAPLLYGGYCACKDDKEYRKAKKNKIVYYKILHIKGVVVAHIYGFCVVVHRQKLGYCLYRLIKY